MSLSDRCKCNVITIKITIKTLKLIITISVTMTIR